MVEPLLYWEDFPLIIISDMLGIVYLCREETSVLMGSLDSVLAWTDNPFRPVQMGDEVVGWASAPYSLRNSDIHGTGFVAVGDEVFSLTYRWLISRCRRANIALPPELLSFALYQADSVFVLPVGSVEVDEYGSFVDSERTLKNLLAAITNFVVSFQIDTQARFNNAELYIAADIYAELGKYHYPYIRRLRWRGQEPASIEVFADEVRRVQAADRFNRLLDKYQSSSGRQR